MKNEKSASGELFKVSLISRKVLKFLGCLIFAVSSLFFLILFGGEMIISGVQIKGIIISVIASVTFVASYLFGINILIRPPFKKK